MKDSENICIFSKTKSIKNNLDKPTLRQNHLVIKRGQCC